MESLSGSKGNERMKSHGGESRAAVVRPADNSSRKIAAAAPIRAMQPIRIRSRILIPLMIAITLLMGAFILVVFADQRRKDTDDIADDAKSVDALLQLQAANDVGMMTAMIHALMREKPMEAAMRSQDRAALLKLGSPILADMRALNKVTHFFFHRPDAVTLLRVHRPELFGDLDDRSTMREARRTGRLSFGAEEGASGTFTLRVVVPWFSRGQLIGYIELGKEFDGGALNLQQVVGVNAFFTLDKKLLDRHEWEEAAIWQHHSVNWDQFPSVILLGQTTDAMPASVADHFSEVSGLGSSTSWRIASEGRVLDALSVPFRDIRGRTVGEMVVVNDVTTAVAAAGRSIFLLAAFSIAVCAGLLAFFYVFLGHVEHELRTARLAEAELEQSDNRRRIESLEVAARTQKMAAAKDIAEAANSAKSEFLASMSHEIRTPLNGVVGMIELLDATEMSPPQRRYVQLAQEAADGLIAVINDVLDFSKIEAGKVQVEAIEFDLHGLAADLTELLVPAATKKKLALSFIVRPNVPRHVIGDPGRVRQVLTNLINNALKFTNHGHVSVRVSLESETADRLTVRVQVEDSGIGIPAERMDRLFKSFSQVDASTTRLFGGTGLGLAISKQLVELMGGQIGVTSVEDRGTTFWFTLVLGVATTLAESTHSGESAKALHGVRARAIEFNPGPNPWKGLLQGLHLLVAEDNEMNQFIMHETLALAGCTCDIVSDGIAAIKAVERRSYDALLMDSQMPGLDGLEAACRIREREAAAPSERKRLPIITVTADALPGDRERCLEAGMDGYISKPLHAEDLFRLIREAVSSESVLPEDSHPTVDPASWPLPEPNLGAPADGQTDSSALAGTADPIDVEALLGRCMHDADFARRTLVKFGRRATEDIEMLRHAAAAGDATELKRLAYNLQAVAALVAAMPLSKIACEIEQSASQNDPRIVAKQLSRLDDEAQRCARFIPGAVQQMTLAVASNGMTN
jgi:signal transduction histidine kinase/CheY-like chemotaxis protein